MQAIRALITAAQTGDVAALRTHLDEHPHLIDALGGGFQKATALHLAVLHNQHAAIRLLIARGANLDSRDFPDNAAPLHFAAARGDLETVRLLVEAGADIEGRGDDYEVGVLGWATCFRTVREDVAAYLLEHGAQLNLWTAIALDRVDAVRGMIARDAALLGARMTRNQHRRTVLHHAAAKNCARMVRLLIDLGADPNATDATGATPLTAASQEGADPAIVEMLVAAGAELDFLTAVNLKRYDLAEAMLAEDPARVGPDGRDTVALHLAVAKKSHDAVRWLIAHGVDVDAKRMMWDCNHAALHITIENGDIALAQILLDAGADPNIRDDKYNATALGWADFFGREDFAKLVRERGGHK
jgi:ankyrin repeat protein